MALASGSYSMQIHPYGSIGAVPSEMIKPPNNLPVSVDTGITTKPLWNLNVTGITFGGQVITFTPANVENQLFLTYDNQTNNFMALNGSSEFNVYPEPNGTYQIFIPETFLQVAAGTSGPQSGSKSLIAVRDPPNGSGSITIQA